jgi:ElaB/YqjD/DUF883 family membrane-anchored ribosome-binding protein
MTESRLTTPETDESAGQAQEKAREVAGQAQDKAQEAGQQARDRVRQQVDQRSTEAGERVKSTAGDARSVAEELRKQGKDAPARYAEQAADRVERVGSWLTDSDGDRILRDVEDFGRRNPWAVVAGGVALGFAASRLLKASSTERYRSAQSDGQQQQPAFNGSGDAAASRPQVSALTGDPQPQRTSPAGDRPLAAPLGRTER